MPRASQYNETEWQAWIDDPGIIDGIGHDDAGDCLCPDALVSVLIDHAPRGAYGWTVGDALRVAEACGEAYSSASGEPEGYVNMGECYVAQYALAAYDDSNIVIDYEATGRAVVEAETDLGLAIWHSCGACRMLHRLNYAKVTGK